MVGQDETWDEEKYEGMQFAEAILDTSLEAARREIHLSWTATSSAVTSLWMIGLTRYNVPL